MKKKAKKKQVVNQPKSKKKLFFLLDNSLITNENALSPWTDFLKGNTNDLSLVIFNTEGQHQGENIQFSNGNLTEALTLVPKTTDHFVCKINPNDIELAKQAVAWFRQNHQKVISKKPMLGVSDSKLGPMDKAWLTMGSWFELRALKSKPLGVNIIPASLANEGLENTSEKPLALFKKAISISNEFEEMPLKADEEPSSMKLFVQAKFLYFSSKLEKYCTGPFAEIKQKGISQEMLRDGNSAVYRLSFFTIALALFLLLPALSFQYGMTWDEPVLVEYAEDILKYYQSGGEDKGVFDMKKHARNATLHYSAFFDLAAQVFYEYLSPFGIYETRHFLNAICGALLMLFIGRLGKELGSWRTALLAILFAALSPRLFGHSMNNPKDIPFALGYAMSLFYLLRFFKQMPKPPFTAFFWVIISFAFMISIKIGGLVVFGFLGIYGGAYWLNQVYKNNLGHGFGLLPRYIGYMLIIIVPSYFLGILFWPWGIEKPLTNPITSLTEFTNFRFLITYELFEGQRINMDSPPAHYTFKWMAISVPLFVIIGAFLSLIPTKEKFKAANGGQILAMIFAFLFPIVYTIIQNSTLYSGWRHLMFAYMPLLVLAAVGWDTILTLFKSVWIPRIATACLVILMGLPAYWMVKNHPNQYVYFNETIGGINGAYTYYETEYWCNAMKEAAEWLVENEPVDEKKVRVAANFEINSAQYYANKLTDSLQMLWTRENEKFKPNWDYAFFGTRGMPKSMIEKSFPPKGTIHVIKADTVPLLAIVKRENSYLPNAHKLRGEGKIRESLAEALKAVEYEPSNAEALRMAGMLYLNMGNQDKALRFFKECIDINADDYVAYTMIGIVYNNKKDYKKAIPFFNKSVALKVNNTSGYYQRGRAYAQLKDYDKALTSYETAAKYDNGRNPYIFVDAATILMQQGLQYPQIKEQRFNMAIRNLQLALRINQNVPEAYRNLAIAYNELGNQANSQKYQAMYQQKLQGN